MQNEVTLRPLEQNSEPEDSLEAVIKRRGSSRRFEQVPIAYEALSTLLATATQRIPADFLGGLEDTLNDLYLIANSVTGLDSGKYLFRRKQGTLELLQPGEFRRDAGYLALGQSLAADAAVNFYFLTDLERVLRSLGNRGYRSAQLEASIRAGKLYLGAYALGLGATGLTFLDDEVTRFFSPSAANKSVMFLMAVGVPRKPRSEAL